MLKRLFTSNTRIKLLTVFLMNPGEEYFIRELTRKLDEQINSVRRELDNLKKLGLFKTKTKNRKKYYCVNKDFILYEELRSMVLKSLANEQGIVKDLEKLGNIKLLVLSGIFTGQEETAADMLLVGKIDREKLSEYLNSLKTERPVRFAILTEEDYQYRLNCKDKFVYDLINNPANQIPIKKIT